MKHENMFACSIYLVSASCRRNEDDDAKEEMYAFMTVPKDESTKGRQTAVVDTTA